MAILNNSNAISTGAYDVNNSLRFRSSASAYLNRTPASAGNRKTWTWSAWVKRGALGSDYGIFSAGTNSSNAIDAFEFNSSNQIRLYSYNSAYLFQYVTTAVYRDPSAWYHIVVAVDTTQATAGNRVKLYVNGQQVTVFSTQTDPTQNSDCNFFNTASLHAIGATYNNSRFLDSYIAEQYFIDGSAKAASDFGETDATTGVWKPKAYTGTYGTNGFYLKFSDIATTSGSNAGLGKDFSGNTNYWTTNNISVTSGVTYDAMKDSPTNTSATVANYCVINTLNRGGGTVSDGNLLEVIPAASGTAGKGAGGTIAASSGKWYAEFVGTVNNNFGVGVMGMENTTQDLFTTGVCYYSVNGQKYVSGVNTSYGATFTTNDIIGVALDIDGGTVTFYKNNTSQGAITLPSLPSSGWRFHVSNGTSLNTQTYAANFGQRPFAYTPPTGFVALNTYNLPTPTILQGNKYMDATLYTGNGSTQVVVNNAQFKPDLVWLKARSINYSHYLYDSVRGALNTLNSNSTGAETSYANSLTSFNSNGFSLGSAGGTNESPNTMVGWQWQAGQGTNTTNTAGSITSTVSVNTTAGFSVVTYTGTGANATVGHGLGVAPRMIICKNRASATDWAVYHASFGNTGALRLNSTIANEVDSRYWNNTTPTSTVFSVGSSSTVNGSSNTQVAYCWSEISGFSKFGSYTGNGSTDGPFVFTNLKPRFIMIKRTDTTSNWTILDTAREGYNVDNDPLYPNLSDAEGTTDLADILSNGFKLRSTDASVNANAGTYIYAAFAESPFSTNNRAR
jgi:hypothetical protein